MIAAELTRDQAEILARFLWMLLMFVWVLLWLGMKKAKRLESPAQMLQHAIPVTLGFWLLFGKPGNFLSQKLWVTSAFVLWTGVWLTALGVATSIWARLILGANWSGVVTLKQDHELIRKGPYRWVRHPIYTGILVSFVGTQLIHARLAGCLGFAVVLASFYLKARREEGFLREEFGPGFDEHARSTGMFFPKWT